MTHKRAESLRRRRRTRGAEWPTEVNWDDRVSDGANPILVRDLVQTSNSRIVTIAVTIASLVIIRIGLSMLSPDEASQALRGRQGFEDLAVLVVQICWALLPFLTFLSMREEVTGAASEHLLLSGLTPGKIILGKVESSLLRTIVIMSLASPLLGLAYVLQGVSLPTLLLAFGFGGLGVIMLSTLAVAGACVCQELRPRALPIAFAAAAFGALGYVADPTVRLLLGVLEGTVVARAWFGIAAAALAMLFVAAAAWLTGTASLAHSYDNRSTGFRVVGLALPVAVLVLLAAMAQPAELATLAPLAALATVVATLPIWICAATEGVDRPGRPRGAASRFLRVLAAPLAPGRGHGLLWVLLLGGVIAGLGFGLPALLGGGASAGITGSRFAVGGVRAMCLLALAYLLLYSGLGAVVRDVLDRRGDPRAWWLARVAVLLVAVASWAVPSILNGIRGVRSLEWNLAHFLNPITTTAQVAREGVRTDLLLWIGGLAALLWLASVPVVARALASAWSGPPDPEEPDAEKPPDASGAASEGVS